MSDSERTASARVALAGFVCGVLGFVCAPGAGGIVALVLGWIAHQEFRAMPGARGHRWALAALGLGSANVVFLAVALSVGLPALQGAPQRSAVAESALAVDRDTFAERSAAVGARSSPALQRSQQRAALRSSKIGRIELVDVGSNIDSLARELSRQMLVARRDGCQLLVWVSAPDCAPCNGVASALSHRELQRALERTRIVRVNRDEFAAELDAIGIPFQGIPGFALLDGEIRPVDYLDGGEWDEDVPHNIAPVLAGFMRGSYNARRRPWRGATQRKITAL
ncbi:MAG TPA: DUF4190 domain-containing protein [Polyangiaceae bacterium]|nr:DUF4190 domain-containing protein [Polyangiaceae bacterium]